MCGADHGPDHDDPVAARVCDLYHSFDRSRLAELRAGLGDRDRELLWQVAVGIGPDGLSRRFSSDPDTLRAELSDLAARLVSLGAGSE